MLEGYADLFKMQLPEEERNTIHNKSNSYVYILKIDSSYYVLDQKEKWIDPNDESLASYRLWDYNYVVYNNYKKVLLELFHNNPNLKNRVKNLKFEDRDIIPLIMDLNNAHPEVPRKTFIVKDKYLISHGPVSGYMYLETVREIVESMEFGYYVDIINPEISENLTHQLGFSFMKVFYTDNYFNRNLSWAYKLPASSRYIFLSGNYSPFIGVGLTYYLSNYFGGLFSISTGFSFYKKMDFIIKLESERLNIHSEKSLTLNFGYRFGVR